METVPVSEALGDEMVVLNVGGVMFKTYYRTLARWPGTRLFNIAYQQAINPRARTYEHFFDNDPTIFSSVLDYYRRGQLAQAATKHCMRSVQGRATYSAVVSQLVFGSTILWRLVRYRSQTPVFGSTILWRLVRYRSQTRVD